MPVFRYKTLRSAHNIRLLLLKPSFKREAPLECNLETCKISAPPRYVALSYTWDGQRPSRPIRCNGSEQMVTPNVETALRQLRGRFWQKRLWIDAVCIDQGSLEERSQQVRLMGQIYRNAAHVIVWLGLADTITLRGINILKWVLPFLELGFRIQLLETYSLAQRNSRKVKARLRDILLQGNLYRKRQSLEVDSESLNYDLWELHQILHHHWFRRIWTLQEISLAKRATVHCGGSKVKWNRLSDILNHNGISTTTSILMEGGYDPELPIYHRVPSVNRMQRVQTLQRWNRLSTQLRPQLPFVLNLILTGLNSEYLATDPKDKIFGLFGILQTFGVALPVPDYQKTLPEILIELFSELAVKHETLYFLLFVTGKHSISGVPSWIPDFSNVPWSPSPRFVRRWCERGLWGMGTTFTIDGRQLHLTGILVDRVIKSTDTISCKGHEDRSTIRDSIDLPSKDFIVQLQEWIAFVQQTVSSRSGSQARGTLLLFELLLHDRVLDFYFENSPGFRKVHHFLQHFEEWLMKVGTQHTLLTSLDDHLLDQAQEFITREQYYNVPDHEIFDRIGYSAALLAIQRWVREYTARKRLFTTSLGYLGIGWHPLKEGDQIACIPGLKSPILLRSVGSASDKTYRLVGPCNVPQPQIGLERWKKHKRYEQYIIV